ncbi:MAG: hypothetical protein SPG61_00790 [Arcanobacterium sp.]|nr:hypothetical protein [Arcanobacterium sp.]
MVSPDIEFVIRFHNLERQPLLTRAVESVLTDDSAGIILVAHNIDPDKIILPKTPRIKIVSLEGEAGLPGAASAAGYKALSAQWAGLLDSDDYFMPNAIATMRTRLQETKADALIAPLHKEGKRNPVHLPTIRTSNLDVVKDKLFYRTAPFGIFRSTFLKDSAEFGRQFHTGEDIPIMAYIYTQAQNIAYFWNDPAYVLGNSATDRITDLLLSDAKVIVQSYNQIWDIPFIADLDSKIKHALAVKLLRINILPLVEKAQDSPEVLTEYAQCVEKILNVDSRAMRSLTWHQQQLIKALLEKNYSLLGNPAKLNIISRNIQKLIQLLDSESQYYWDRSERKFQRALRK